MKWRKLGLVYVPTGSQPWAVSHAYLPTPDVRDDGTIDVYFSALDAEKRGRIGRVQLSSTDPRHILHVTDEPLFDLGALGAFDDAGVNPSTLLHVHGETRLYYLGWQRGLSVPYQIFLGLATRKHEASPFVRWSAAPVLERTRDEPFFRSAATIVPTAEGYRMWYVSVRRWLEGEPPTPEYVIRSAVSPDGFAWQAEEGTSIDFASPDEFGFGRPWVLRDPDRWRMWYSIRSRSEPYRLGYAESHDGRVWTRRDDLVGIARSAQGWDSEMICFASVVDAGGERYLFYNGNRHGATGFGVAVLEQD